MILKGIKVFQNAMIPNTYVYTVLLYCMIKLITNGLLVIAAVTFSIKFMAIHRHRNS